MKGLQGQAYWRDRVRLARGLQVLGFSGLIGVAMLSTAAGVAATSYFEKHQAGETDSDLVPATSPTVMATGNDDVPPISLPGSSDMGSAVAGLESLAQRRQLSWASATYRWLPQTDTVPASVEISGTLFGPYPQIRSMVSEALSTVQGLVLREIQLSRPNADAADVQAKMVFGLLLQDTTPVPASGNGGRP